MIRLVEVDLGTDRTPCHTEQQLADDWIPAAQVPDGLVILLLDGIFE